LGVEIERKFLVQSEAWRAEAGPGERFRQGYLVNGKARSVRVRREGERAFITIKGPRRGIVRSEFEYEIPTAEADQMLAELCAKPLLEKTRHRVAHFDAVWEIDEYGGEHGGLVIAEIELDHADELVVLPAWIGREVTHDPRYRASAISSLAAGQGADADADPG
jgi:adenylate cyclase